MLHFANQYGSLGGVHSAKLSEPDPNSANSFWPVQSERLADWLKEIRIMRHAVIDLYDNIKARYARDLLPFVKWENFRDRAEAHTRTLYIPPSINDRHSDSIVVYNSRLDKSFPSLRQGDVFVPAWRGLLELVGAQLKRFPITATLEDISAGDVESARLVLPAPGLIAALWLQFARAIAENRQFSFCKECGSPFETTTEKRVDAQFCTAACRLRVAPPLLA